MDITSKFENLVALKSFVSFKCFSQALSTFQQIHGYTYIKLNSSRCRPGQAGATDIIYRHISYMCASYGCKNLEKSNKSGCGTGCKSMLRVGAVNGLLHVISYNMQHNHAPKFPFGLSESDSAYSKHSDLTIKSDEDVPLHIDNFKLIFMKTSFSTFFEFYRLLKQFEESTGYVYTKQKSNKYPVDHPEAKTIVYKRIKMACFHYGSHTSVATVRMKKKSFKLGCSSFIQLKVVDGELRIFRCELRHNHPARPETSSLYQRKKQRYSLTENILNKSSIDNKKQPDMTPKKYFPMEKRLSELSYRLSHLQDLACESPSDLFEKHLRSLDELTSIWSADEEAVISGKVHSFESPSIQLDNTIPYFSPEPAHNFANRAQHFLDVFDSNPGTMTSNIVIDPFIANYNVVALPHNSRITPSFPSFPQTGESSFGYDNFPTDQEDT